MTATQEAVQAPATTGARRNEKVGEVVSNKMQRHCGRGRDRKAASQVKRIIAPPRSFYAHDEAELSTHGRRG